MSDARYFFALLPPASTRTRLARLATESGGTASSGPRPRAIAEEKLHLTLTFLGPLDRAQLDSATLIGSAVRAARFTLRLDHLEHWPRPGILCSRPSRTPTALLELVDGLHDRLRACGLRLEARPFRAHVSLLRKTPSDFRIRGAVHPPVDWPARSFALVQSAHSPKGGGHAYRVLGRWDLQAPRDDDTAALCDNLGPR